MISGSFLVKNMLSQTHIRQTELAEKLNVTSASISQRIKNDSWKLQDLEAISNILGFTLEMKLINKNGEYFVIKSGKND
jgi:plasmid maintenance system antidote protein VapI